MSTGFWDATPGNLVVRYCTDFLEDGAASACRTLKLHLKSYGKKRFFTCFVNVLCRLYSFFWIRLF